MILPTLLLLAGTAAAPTELDGLITFEREGMCRPTVPFGDFLSDLVNITPDEQLIAGKITAPSALRGAFGQILLTWYNGRTEVSVPVQGTWRGIPVVRITSAYPEGGDPANLAIAFQSDLATLSTVTRQAGFPPSGTVLEEGAYTSEFSLEGSKSDPAIVILHCDVR